MGLEGIEQEERGYRAEGERITNGERGYRTGGDRVYNRMRGGIEWG